jgi:hypothetical protein
VASETNQEAYNRLQRTIGTDNWVNLNSFDVNFSERLPGIIKSYSIIGHGEPEMYRDLIQTGIPIRKFRLTFTEKVDLTLRQKNEDGVLVTTFLFNDDPDIIYTVKEHNISPQEVVSFGWKGKTEALTNQTEAVRLKLISDLK